MYRKSALNSSFIRKLSFLLSPSFDLAAEYHSYTPNVLCYRKKNIFKMNFCEHLPVYFISRSLFVYALLHLAFFNILCFVFASQQFWIICLNKMFKDEKSKSSRIENRIIHVLTQEFLILELCAYAYRIPLIVLSYTRFSIHLQFSKHGVTKKEILSKKYRNNSNKRKRNEKCLRRKETDTMKLKIKI